MTLSLTAAAIAIAAFVVPAEAADQTIDWSFGTDDGLDKFDILQCQAVTFDWMAGGFHNVREFPDEESYDACDFTNAKEIAASAEFGTFTISDDDTLDVTKRWFGCQVGNHCDAENGGGQMKVAVKIRPLLRQKYPGFECMEGTEDVTKEEPNLKACRKRCKRRRGCIAIQYESSTQECRVYSEAPIQGMASEFATCEIATTTCSESPELPMQTPMPAPAGDPECSIEVRVGCKLSSDGTTECSDLPNLPTPVPQNEQNCRVLVNYTYSVKHFGPEGAILKSTIRTREGDVRNYQTATVGFPAKDAVLNTWEEDYVNLCETKRYTTYVETISELASAGLECVEWKAYVIDMDPSAEPPTEAPPCDLDLEVSCLVGDDEIDCASIKPPDGSCSKDVARNRPVEASSTYRNWKIYEPWRIVDGDSGTRWTSDYADNQWVSIDLGENYAINRVVLAWEAAHAQSYDLQVSADGSDWITVYSTNNSNGGKEVVDFASQSGKYVRLNLLTRATQYGFSLFDFEVYTAQDDAMTPGSTPSPERPITYRYKIHNFGSTDATILSVLRTRPDALFNGDEYDFSSVFPTPMKLERLFQTTISEGPYLLNFCDPKRSYETTFDVSATCDGGATTYDGQEYYAFEVV